MASLVSWLANAGSKKTDGAANAGGKIYFYLPGSTTLAAVYKDEDRDEQHPSPVVLDAAGRATVYTDRFVRLDIFDSAGVLVSSFDRANADYADQVEVEDNDWFTGTQSNGSQGAGGRTDLNTVLTSLGSSAGGHDGKFLDSAGGTERAMSVVVGEQRLSVKDRGAIGDGLTDDTNALKAAIAVMKGRAGGTLYVPRGTYLITDALALDFTGLTIRGDGINSSLIKFPSTVANKNAITATGVIGYRIENLRLSSVTASSGAGLSMTDSQGVVLLNVAIDGFKYSVDMAGACFLCNFYSLILTDPVTTAGYGARIAGTSTAVNFWGADFEGVAGQGLLIDGAASRIGVYGSNFMALAMGIKVAATCTGSAFVLVGNDFSTIPFGSTAVSVLPVTACKFREYGNDYGNAGGPTVTDNSAGAVWGSFNGGRYGVATQPANILNLAGGRAFSVAGATTIDYINTAGWQAGDIVTLFLVGPNTPTLTHVAGAATATYAPIKLAASVNFAGAAKPNTIVQLCYDATAWFEVGRTVIAP